MNVLQMFYQTVESNPAKECLRYKQNGSYQSFSYQQIWEQANQFAKGLQQLGVVAGENVGIISNNCPQWVINDLACMFLQATVVPIYPTLPSNQVKYIMEHASINIIIVQDQSQLQKVEQEWPGGTVKRILIDPANVTDADVDADVDANVTEKKENVFTFDEIIALGVSSEAEPFDFTSISEDQIASIVYTSGTSGTPKGVLLTHRNLVSNVIASTSYVYVEPTDVTLSYLPLSHIFERTIGHYAPFSKGATVVYAEGIDKILQNLQEVRPTVLVTVPRLLEKVYSKIQQQIGDLSTPVKWLIQKGMNSNTRWNPAYKLVDSRVYQKLRDGFGGNLRYIVSGGSGLAGTIMEFFQKAGIDVYEGYGMTETAPVICVNPFKQSRPGSVGKPVPGVSIKIADDGELLVKGPNVMQGYYHAEEETAKVFTADGWLNTGDIAELSEDGYVKIVDRKKNLLVLGTGKNIAPWPIENAISLSPYISEAILVGDNRQYVTCLVFPDFEALREIAASLSLEDDKQAWVQHPEVQNLIRQEVQNRVNHFAPFEKPKRAVLFPHELSLEAGEITPTLKIRNQQVLKKYADRIHAMYEGTDYIALF